MATAIPSTVKAETDDIHNGFFWEGLRIDHRVFYVVGFRDGSTSANNQWEIDTQSHQRDRSSIPNKVTIQNSPMAQQAASYADFGGVANGQLVEGIDKFYSDFRNKQIHVQEAMQYVKDQIKGKDPALLEKNLNVLRKYAAQS